jgi:hypothetical protein
MTSNKRDGAMPRLKFLQFAAEPRPSDRTVINDRVLLRGERLMVRPEIESRAAA